jgi:NADH-quinone oxidoreductase subunit F
MLGTGTPMVFDETTSVTRAVTRWLEFYKHESCGKCTPCREGTTWLERVLDRIIEGQGRPEDVDLLLDVCDNISPGMVWPPKQTTICPLGQSATPSIAGVVRRIPEEFERYLGTSFSTTVSLGGAAYVTKPTAAAGAPGGAAQ